MSLSLLLVVAGIVVLIWIGVRFGTPRATAVAPDDPLWVAAIQAARASIPAMRELHGEGRDVWVKFPVRTDRGTTEHVWGRVAALGADTLECTIETPTIERAASTSAGMVEVSLSELEDWQVELEDHSIRGGFTTRAEAEIARRDGQHVPRHVQDMIRRMTDQQGQAT